MLFSIQVVPDQVEVIALPLERLAVMNGTANVTFDRVIFEHAN